AEQTEVPPKILAAGAPRFLGESATDDAFFAELAAANMTSFLPIFQYQEVPESQSLPREADFYPPCSRDDDPFRSMRVPGVKLVIPGNLLYASDLTPEQGDEILRTIIDCAGEDGVAAIFSVDEPALGNPDLDQREAQVRLLYERSKLIAPSVPVVMVHAPVMTEWLNSDGTWSPVTVEQTEAYLAAVSRLSVWSDIVGFDLYIIPAETAKFSAPGHGIDVVDDVVAIPAYLDWLAVNAPGKETLLVLQGFSYTNLLGLDEEIDATRRPSLHELTRMACAGWLGGVSHLAWWGQSFLRESDGALWNDIKAVSLSISTDPRTLCG
ncbi:MAG: hypothetical protein ABL994_21700, partial [Verrucomicrobiales bacterium]